MTATYAASRRLGRVMPPPEVSLVAAHPPPQLVETTEQPDNRWVGTAEKVWATTHPVNQGLAIVGMAVITVALIRAAAPKLDTLYRIWKGQPDKGATDVPAQPFTPPPEPTEVDKRNEELLAILSDMARKLQRVDQNVHNVVAEVRLLESGVGDLKRRIGDIEGRLTTAVTREEMRIALDLVSELAKAR